MYDDFWVFGLDKEVIIYICVFVWLGINKFGIIMFEIVGCLCCFVGCFYFVSGLKIRIVLKDKFKI